MPPSSRGLGHLPFTEATGIRIPLGVSLIDSKSQSIEDLESLESDER